VRMVKRPRGADRRQRGGQRAARFECCSQGLSNPGCRTSDRGCGPIVTALRGVSPQPHGGRSHGLGRARNRRLDRRAAESPAQGRSVMSAFLPNPSPRGPTQPLTTIGGIERCKLASSETWPNRVKNMEETRTRCLLRRSARCMRIVWPISNVMATRCASRKRHSQQNHARSATSNP
jgi:hypothetical protein